MKTPWILMLAGTIACGAVHAGPITVAWREKAPYHHTENGIEQGFLLQRGKAIFAKAGVEARFVEMPTKRIWASFEEGKAAFCSLGRYRLDTRDPIVQYTDAMHFDAPQVVLVAPAALDRVKTHKTLASLLADDRLSLGLIDGASYGPALDQMITGSKAQVLRRKADPINAIEVLALDRIAYTFADQLSWEYLRKRRPELASVTPLSFPDSPAGLARHIMCSKDIPPETMGKLNRAIKALKISERTPVE